MALTVRAAGEIDMATATALIVDINEAICSLAPGGALVIDLGAVSFLDSSGISALLTARRDALGAGLSLQVVNVGDVVLRTLQLAGVASVLGIEGSEPGQRHGTDNIDGIDGTMVEPALTALSRYFVGDSTMGETLQCVAHVTLNALPHAAFAGIAMMVGGRLGTVAATHPELDDIESAQYDTGEGPCVDAIRTGEPVHIHVTGSDVRYRAFRIAARRHGVNSVLSLPMKTTSETIGALNLYGHREDAFSADDMRVGAAFATQAAYLLVNAQAYWDARSLSENLSKAMASRAEIEQAKGIIMATSGMSAEAAFEQLVKQSQHENVKVRDLAVEIVGRAQRKRHA